MEVYIKLSPKYPHWLRVFDPDKDKSAILFQVPKPVEIIALLCICNSPSGAFQGAF